MKQLDLILCAVALVVGIVASWTVWAMRKQPEFAPAVKTIDVAPVGLPAAQPAYSTALPGAQGGAMGRGGRGGKGKGGFVG